MDRLRSYLQINLPFEGDQLDAVVKFFKPRTLKRHSNLLSPGEVCKELYFVARGCIRTYFLDKAGRERTRYIAFDGAVGTALHSFITQKSSTEYVETLEDSELLYISRKDFYGLVETVPQWANYYRLLLESAYSYQNSRIENLVTLTARQRYEDVLVNHPQYIYRLPNHILASFLDMSQETLSRLKSK